MATSTNWPGHSAGTMTDARHLGHALAVLFTVGGTPSIYYGDEQAFQGVKEEREGGDDAIRPAFPDGPGELAPYGWPTYRLHQRLAGLRRRHPWLVGARTTVEHLANRAIALRSGADEAQIIALLNLHDLPYRFPIDVGSLTVSVTPEPEPRASSEPTLVPAHSWTIFAP